MKIKKKPVSELSLPDTKSGASDSLFDYIILITGEKKIGKTSLASHMGPAPFFAMFEPGGKAQSLYQRPINSWDDWLVYMRLLRKNHRFNPVVIDTADMMYRLCFDFVCKRMGIDHPSDEAYGKGWEAVRQEMNLTFNKLGALGKGIILISHSKEAEVKKRDGTSHHLIVPALSGQARDIIEPLVDIWGYYHYDGDARFLQIQGDDQVSAGHRTGHRFRYTDGTPIKSIPMGNSSREAYSNFTLAWENQLPKEGGSTKERLVVRKKVSVKRSNR